MSKMVSQESFENVVNHMVTLYQSSALALADAVYQTLKNTFDSGRLTEKQFEYFTNIRNAVIKTLDIPVTQLLDLNPDDGWVLSDMPVTCIFPDQVPTLKSLIGRNGKTGVCIYS